MKHVATPSTNDATRATFEGRTWIHDGQDVPFVAIELRDDVAHVTGEPRAFIGHRMQVCGEDMPRGIWGEWKWEDNTLKARVDAMGFQSLFVYASDRRVIVSPSLLQVIAQGADPSPDPVARAVYQSVGFYVCNDTPFKHIKVLPPGGRLTWSHGRAIYSTPARRFDCVDLTQDQAIEAMIEVPRSAIRRFVATWNGEMVLPLSSGRLSRHILLEMAHQGRRPDMCVTHYHSGDALPASVKAARAVADFVGVPHKLLGYPRLRLRDNLRGILLTQLCSDELGQMMPLHDYLSGGSAAAIDGTGGGVLGNAWQAGSGFGAKIGTVAEADFEAGARGMIAGHQSVIGAVQDNSDPDAVAISPDLHEAAISRIAEAIAAYAGASDPYQAFWFYNRTRRETAFIPTAIMGGAPTVFSPYLDPEFVEMGLSLSASISQDRSLYPKAIAKAYPSAAHIPFADGFNDDQPGKLRFSRARNALDSLRVAKLLGYGSFLGHGLLWGRKGTHMDRDQAEIMCIQRDFLADLNADKARGLLDLQSRLNEEARKGNEVVNQVYLAM